MLPDSDKRYYSASELSGYSKEHLRIARNELYARHGRLFSDPSLQEHFDSCSWYHGSMEAEDFKGTLIFNEYEIANRDRIVPLE